MEKGFSIYIVIMILAMILSSVLGLNIILMQQAKSIRNIGYSISAFYAADTGTEQVIKRLNSADYRDFPTYDYDIDGNASYSVEAVCCDKSKQKCAFKANPADCPIHDEFGKIIQEFSDGGLCQPDGSDMTFCARITGKFKGVKRTIEVKI